MNNVAVHIRFIIKEHVLSNRFFFVFEYQEILYCGLFIMVKSYHEFLVLLHP